jgi:FMN phosphatase YigB (HAD superfamily)
MRQAVIFDCDGTLFDVRSIRHYVTDTTRDFDKFHTESVNVPTHAAVVEAFHRHQSEGLACLIVTARQFKYVFHTMFALSMAGTNDYEQLYMRRTGDFRPDAEVKRDILRLIREDGFDPVLAYDDRECVAEVWRSAGIETIMVNEQGNLVV